MPDGRVEYFLSQGSDDKFVKKPVFQQLNAAKIFKTILEGNGTEAQNNVVLTNAAFALKIVDETKSFETAFSEAKDSLFGLKAKQTLEKLVRLQNEKKEELNFNYSRIFINGGSSWYSDKKLNETCCYWFDCRNYSLFFFKIQK